jgi:hypothetical protein
VARESELPGSLALAFTKGISQVQLSHTRRVVGADFDEPNLVSAAGLVPVVALARDAGLRALSDRHLSVPTDKGRVAYPVGSRAARSPVSASRSRLSVPIADSLG